MAPDEETREADLRLDLADAANDLGVIQPGDADNSELWKRIVTDDASARMPPREFHKELDDDQKRLIRNWIESGAKHEKHWAFVTPKRPAVPAGDHSNPIDAFIQHRLQQEGLSPAAKADRRTLIRRLTLDLTGLPPTPEEVSEFVNSSAPDAYENLVDRLTSQTTYGEHMARYWLDLARYADTHGLHLDNERSMWPYRDWVVRAFAENVPFDEFTRWQLAGDLLENPSRDQLIASGSIGAT